MGTASRIWLSLAGFLVIAGLVYGLTSHEVAGAPLLLVGGATFCYLGLVGRAAVRRRAPEEGSGAGREAEVHVAPVARRSGRGRVRPARSRVTDLVFEAAVMIGYAS